MSETRDVPEILRLTKEVERLMDDLPATVAKVALDIAESRLKRALGRLSAGTISFPEFREDLEVARRFALSAIPRPRISAGSPCTA